MDAEKVADIGPQGLKDAREASRARPPPVAHSDWRASFVKKRPVRGDAHPQVLGGGHPQGRKPAADCPPKEA